MPGEEASMDVHEYQAKELLGLAAGAGMDLGLHRPVPAAEFGRGVDRLIGAERHRATKPDPEREALRERDTHAR
jgi:hypothetical protein